MENTASRDQKIARFHGFKTEVLERSVTIREIVFVGMVFLCLTPWVSPPLALLLGLVMAQLIGHPFQRINHKLTSFLLKVAVVGLGFGINFQSALKAGSEGFLFTVITIAGTLLFGALVGKLLGIEKKTSALISSGTAICGGSAIAAVAPAIGAEERQTSVALGTVFILNAVALFVFPEIGAWLHMTQNQFGLWAAIAIHDTSSVVGAASKYGAEALQIATTVKLARSLWIIPVAAIMSFIFKQHKQNRVQFPWFIGLFVVAMLLYSYFPIIQPVTPYIVHTAKSCLTVTLFLIGAGLSKEVVQQVGWKPLLQGVIVWLVISIGTLFMILGTT
ncbi:conserved hypothetical protein [Chloroherpeton thalassium ATCC 35110]|uniref:Uncharacterized protein n=1 Tax=Chloroherpeton thalassium (strain ATCC 35110 / GB-78) TaxID=517418 RepID=B3QTT6_CHLT3|nr:putative sulfate exporter family transporter [Chloroherpeton thalassium]ACF14284.1 conserved hypothetical protein [Chloroherpeton thalassium ATCC 35110]